MKIIIGADIVPTQSNNELFASGDAKAIVGDVLFAELQTASFRIFNLETPLADIEAPILKMGPNLVAPERTIKGIRAIGVDFVTLANNHIMDQGEKGLYSTIKALNEYGVLYGGAGNSIKETESAVSVTIDGKKIGIYLCCEHEFSIAQDNKAGAAPFDPLYSLDEIKDLKSQCDYLICLYHGGKEFYRYPSPELQRVCRRITEKGADLVICQHSHCIGTYEQYNGSTIVYGQGNFLFDRGENEYKNTGMLVEILDDFSIRYYFVEKASERVCACSEEKQKLLQKELDERSRKLDDSEFIKEEYLRFATAQMSKYFNILKGKDSKLSIIKNYITKGYWKQKQLTDAYDEEQIAAILNVMECEAHKELVTTAIKAVCDNDNTKKELKRVFSMNRIKSVFTIAKLKLRFGKRIQISRGGVINIHKTCTINVRNGASLILGSGIGLYKGVDIGVVQGECNIGDGVGFNRNCIVACRNSIRIEDNCIFGPNVCIYDHDHIYDNNGIQNKYKVGEISIGTKCWIGANVTILRGTSIGDGCIIGAGCVVKGMIPAHSIVFSENRNLTIRPI